jgi:hypothetical protein
LICKVLIRMRMQTSGTRSFPQLLHTTDFAIFSEGYSQETAALCTFP